MITRSKHVVTLIEDELGPYERKTFCQNCRKVGVTSELKHRIYQDEQGQIIKDPGEDSDNWKQCWTCGLIVPIHDVEQEAKLAPVREIDDGHIIGKDKGMTTVYKRGIKGRKKSLQNKKMQNQVKDSDLNKILDKPGVELLSYEEY